MPISKRTQLAQARRHLKRIEEDEPAFRIRIRGFSPEAQEKAMQWFCGIRDKQRAYVQQLETDLADGQLT
jgi:hypothetical protein